MRWIPLVILMLCAICANAEKATRVVTLTITPDSVQRTLSLSATTRAANHAQLSSLIEGVVTVLHAQAGDVVKKGQVLLELDAVLAQAQVKSLAASFAQQQAALQEAQRLLDEAQSLSDSQFVAKTEIAQRESALAQAKANLAKARADFGYQKELLARHKLYAPFSGVIATRSTDVGEWLNRGDLTFELVSNQTLWLDIAVPQEYFSRIQPDASISVRFDALSQQVYPADILAKIPVVNDVNRSFLLRLGLPQNDALQVGMSARVKIPLNSSHDGVVLIPSDALLREPDGRYSVFVVKQNQARRKSVEIGQRVKESIEITSGLELGQLVVTQGNELLKEGQAVDVINPKGDAL